jgi:hypothetical protein
MKSVYLLRHLLLIGVPINDVTALARVFDRFAVRSRLGPNGIPDGHRIRIDDAFITSLTVPTGDVSVTGGCAAGAALAAACWVTNAVPNIATTRTSSQLTVRIAPP